MTVKFDQPSLAFETQPDLEALLRLLATTEDPVTIVCGAGLSVEAGFPTWGTLLERMCALVDEPLRGMLLADTADPLRKAEYVLDLAGGVRSRDEIVRDALYEGGVAAEPGLIADAVARLVSARPQTRLLTTNFENQLETALLPYVARAPEPFPLDRSGEWLVAPAADAGVLHVHGMLSPGNGKQLKPLILTESQFRQHGAEVRDVLRQVLSTSHVVFVGVSLTDPNLVGPLGDIVGTGHGMQHFALAVADRVPGYDDPADCFEYLVNKAAYLRRAFELKPILLKSYAQISQLLYDATLAIAQPKRYFSTNKKTSLRYGHRFQRALAEAYRATGARRAADFPIQDAARGFSDRLREELEAKDGPERFLRDLAAGLSPSELRKHGLTREFVLAERFSLFLWLRARSGTADQFPPFALRLVGSSAFAHWHPWSFDRVQEIQPGNPGYADAAFRGNVDHSNLDGSDVWRYGWSVPVIRTDEGELDVLSLGVAVLYSTRPVCPLGTLKAAASGREDVPRLHNPSVISFLSDPERAEVKRRITRSALKSLGMA